MLLLWPPSPGVNIISEVTGKVISSCWWASSTQAKAAHQMSLSLAFSLMKCGKWRVSHQICFASPYRTKGALWHGWPLNHLSALTAFSQSKKCCISTNDLFSSLRPSWTMPQESAPPALPDLTSLMGSDAIRYKPQNYSFTMFQLSYIKSQRCDTFCLKNLNTALKNIDIRKILE